MSDGRDDAKKAILARRARFVAAAVAGLGIACGKEKAEPPQPCLSVAYIPPEGGVPSDADAGQPMPCLTANPVPPAAPDGGTPRPCLSRAMPRDAGREPK